MWKWITTIALCVAVIFGCKEKEKPVPRSLQDLYHNSVGEGLPIIVIHGGPGLGSSYLEDHLMPLSKDHTLIFYDQRNSGRSPITTDTSKIRLDAFVEDVENLRLHYGHDQVAILAHSWGSLIAYNYVRKYPQHTSHLILMNALTPDAQLNEQANTKIANRFSADDLEAMARIRRTEAFKNQNPLAYEELMEIGFTYQFSDPNMIRALKLNLPEDFGEKSQLLANLYQDLTAYDFTDQLKIQGIKTLLLYGLDDPLTPFALNNLPSLFPAHMIEPIEDAGHFPFIEKNKETLSAIKVFLY